MLPRRQTHSTVGANEVVLADGMPAHRADQIFLGRCALLCRLMIDRFWRSPAFRIRRLVVVIVVRPLLIHGNLPLLQRKPCSPRAQHGQHSLRHFADHGVCRIIDIPHVILHALPQERTGCRNVQSVVLL